MSGKSSRGLNRLIVAIEISRERERDFLTDEIVEDSFANAECCHVCGMPHMKMTEFFTAVKKAKAASRD